MSTERFRIISPEQIAEKIADPTSPIGAAVRAAAPSGTNLPRKRAVSVTSLPVLLGNRRRWQQSAYTQDNITTLADGTQLVIVLNQLLNPILLKRASGDVSKWMQVVDLSTVSGNPFGLPQGDDSHNTWTVTETSDHHIHIVGNMHADPLRYAKTTVPGDLTSFAQGPLPSANADMVTYCMHPAPVGTGSVKTQFRFYRNGLATSGDFFYQKWLPANNNWTEPVKLFDGIVSNEGAYLNRIAVRGDKIGIFFMWRGEGDASTNTDLGYIESIDGGTTWRRIDGTAQTLPVTHANAPTILPTPIQSGLINQSGSDIDVDGKPHAAVQLYDADGNSHIYHIRHNGSAWIKDDITPDWSLRVETIAQTTLDLKVARPTIICTDSGRTFVIVRTIGEGLNGRPVLIDCSAGASRRPGILFDHDLAGWEPAIDSRALRERNELNMLITSIDQNADSKRGWIAQWGGILSIPCDYLPAIASGTVRVGGIRKVTEFPYPLEIAAVGGVTEANVVSFGVPQVDIAKTYGLGVKVFARLSGRVTFNSGTTSAKIFLRETPSAGSLPTADICTIDMVNSSLAGIVSSPWEPLQQTSYVETNGTIRDTRLIPRIVCNNAAGIKIGAWNVEIGVLENY